LLSLTLEITSINRNPWIEPAETNVTSGVNDVDLVGAPEAGQWGKLQVKAMLQNGTKRLYKLVLQAY
jgi:hypothetical protein